MNHCLERHLNDVVSHPDKFSDKEKMDALKSFADGYITLAKYVDDLKKEIIEYAKVNLGTQDQDILMDILGFTRVSNNDCSNCKYYRCLCKEDRFSPAEYGCTEENDSKSFNIGENLYCDTFKEN